MKPLKTAALAILCLAGMNHAMAGGTSFTYDHEYTDEDKEHTDEFKISHSFDFGLDASATLKFEPDENNKGEPGSAFQDDRWHETKVSLGYPLDISDDWTLEPGTSLARKRGEYKYKPFIKFKYAVTDTTAINGRYRYEMTDYVQDKDTKRTNRYDLGVSHKFGRTKAKYTYVHYQSNTELFDNKKTDYENKVEFEYKLTKKFSPFVEFKDESVSKSDDDRQIEYKLGFKYKL